MAKILRVRRDLRIRKPAPGAWVTTGEAARLLKLSNQRIQTKIRAGHFPSTRVCECGRTFLIKRTELKR